MTRSLILLALLCAQPATWAAGATAESAFGLEDARRLMDSALEYARAHQAPGGAIAIVDDGGQLIMLERLDGTFPAAPSVATGKARTAALFRKPTRDFEKLVNEGRVTMLALPDVTSFTPLQGGVPILIAGAVVGAIGVSGAASAAQDDEIAQAAVDAFQAQAASEDGAVSHLDADAVKRAFSRGAALVESPAFKVHASRRDTPGEAEVHVRDTDIFYVLKGSARILTGGALVAAREVSAGELRGDSIAGGESRSLRQGDVIVIPRGVPHWFEKVSGPFEYYVVKSSN